MAKKGNGVTAEDEDVVLWVDEEEIEETDIPAGVELDEAGVTGDRYLLGVGRNELRWGVLQGLEALVFCGTDPEALVIGQWLSGIVGAVVLEPLAIGDDGVVEADDDGLDVGGEIGFDQLVEDGGVMEDGVGEMDGGVEEGDGVWVGLWASGRFRLRDCRLGGVWG